MKIQFGISFLIKREVYLICFLLIFPGTFASGLNRPVLKDLYITANNLQQVIRGRVTDEEGMPLPGVAVQVKDTTIGAVTDFDGNYEIYINDFQAVLKFSYLGYTNQEIPVNNRSLINVSLQRDQDVLDEVVIVSYGTQKKENITGAISTISAEDLQDEPVAQFVQQLQGKIPGVKINQFNGEPGRGTGIRIRGAASLFAGNQPLFVIDGMPINGNLKEINPATIETITVLKDASATALYGSRAANGVILVTTKHAEPGENHIRLSGYYGIQKIPQNLMPELMNAREYAQFQKEFYEDRVKYEDYEGEINPIYANPEQYGEGTDWLDVMTRVAPIQSYNLTVASANEKSSTTAILGYFKQDGVVINTATQRYSLRLNQSFSLFEDDLTIGFNLAPSYRIDHNNRLPTTGLGGIIQDAKEASPLVEPVNPDGSMPYYVNSPGMVNKVNQYAYMMKIKDDYKVSQILGNGYLDYEFLKGLTLKTSLGIDRAARMRNRFVPSAIVGNGIARGHSSSIHNYTWTAGANLQYDKTFSNDHHIEALIGYSAQKFESESNSISATNFPSDNVEWLSAATEITDGGSNTSQYSLLSQIARLNYNYKGKYLISGAIRRDGSSRFGSERKFGYFPSISAGWNITKEGFMDKSNTIDLLKIRASYGVTGNNNIGNYTFLSNMGNYNYVFNGTLVPGISVSSLGNSDLAWERNKQLDIGLDLAVINNRISFTYDYYHKISDGLIMNRQIPRASGFSTITYNIGEFEFWGHEFALNTFNLTGELKWKTNLNVTINRNVINSLVDPGFIRNNNTTSSDYFRHKEGHSIGEFFGLIYLGLYEDQQDLESSAKIEGWRNWFSAVGTEKMKDVNGDGVIDPNDRTFIGDPTPDFNFGFTNNFNYKNWDLGITMIGSVGGLVLNVSKKYSTNMMGLRMLLKEAGDRWRSVEDANALYPRTMRHTTNIHNQVNSRFVEDGSYVSFKNISLGYSPELRNSPFISNFRIYASVQNAFLITAYSGMNPQANRSGSDPMGGIGIDTNSYPVPRVFSLGIDLMIE